MKKYLAAFAVQLLVLLAVGLSLSALPRAAETYGREYTAKMTDCYVYEDWLTPGGKGAYVYFTGECPSVGLFNTVRNEEENSSISLDCSYDRQTMHLYCSRTVTDPGAAKTACALLGDNFDTTESESFCLRHDVEARFSVFGKSISAFQITVDGVPVEQFFASQSP